MIRYKLTDLLAKHIFSTGKRVEWQDVAEATGVHRTTLSRMINVRGYAATTTSIDRLCRFFSCQVGDVIEYVPDEELQAPVIASQKGPKSGTDAAKAGAKARYAKANEASPAAKSSRSK